MTKTYIQIKVTLGNSAYIQSLIPTIIKQYGIEKGHYPKQFENLIENAPFNTPLHLYLANGYEACMMDAPSDTPIMDSVASITESENGYIWHIPCWDTKAKATPMLYLYSTESLIKLMLNFENERFTVSVKATDSDRLYDENAPYFTVQY